VRQLFGRTFARRGERFRAGASRWTDWQATLLRSPAVAACNPLGHSRVLGV